MNNILVNIMCPTTDAKQFFESIKITYLESDLTYLEIYDYITDKKIDLTNDVNKIYKDAYDSSDCLIIKLLLYSNKVSLCINDNEPIQFAARFDLLELFNYLFNHGADASANESVSLISAVYNGNVDMVKTLLTDIKVNPISNNNLALIKAVENNRLEIIELLCLDPRTHPILYNSSIFELAVNEGYTKIVQFLITDNRCNIKINDNNPLQLAFLSKNMDMINLLLDEPRFRISRALKKSMLRYYNEDNHSIVCMLINNVSKVYKAR